MYSDGCSTAEDLQKSASEVRVEDVVDDRIQHGATVLEPLERRDSLWRDVRLTALAGSVHDVRGEERQVKHHEDGEQDAEDTNGASASVYRRHHRARSPTVLPRVGRAAAGALLLRPAQIAAGVAAGCAAIGNGIRLQCRVTDRRREQCLDLGWCLRTGCCIPDPSAAAGRFRASESGAVFPAVRAELIDCHTSLFAQLTTQGVHGERVHDGHNEKWNVE